MAYDKQPTMPPSSDGDWLIDRSQESKNHTPASDTKSNPDMVGRIFGLAALALVGSVVDYLFLSNWPFDKKINEAEAKMPFDRGSTRFFVVEGHTPVMQIPFAEWVAVVDGVENGATAGTSDINAYCRTTYIQAAFASSNGVYIDRPDFRGNYFFGGSYIYGGWYDFHMWVHNKECTVKPPGPPQPVLKPG